MPEDEKPQPLEVTVTNQVEPETDQTYESTLDANYEDNSPTEEDLGEDFGDT